VSGPLLDNISTEDTARDLNRLRQLVGDRKLTYVGLSYGSMIGQTYENMFPGRVRAMLLDGIVDPVEYTVSAERRVANQAGFADQVFFRAFVRQCQRAGPSGCALAGHSESVARRVARLDLERPYLDQAAPGHQSARPDRRVDVLRRGHRHRGSVRRRQQGRQLR
jgi:pimeloyl-ACP methyl ester carboxylesterase